MTRAAAIALAHGGGPMPVLGDPSHREIIQSLKVRVPALLRLGTAEAPRAIVVVTAHWSTANPTVSNAAKHKLLFDYYGFPPQSYSLVYDAPGSPEVAMELFEALKAEGLTPELDAERGWDHGVFIPLLLIHPAATIPIVQLSVLSSESVPAHFAMGRALAKLRDKNVAIIGSGLASFHNLKAMANGHIREAKFQKSMVEWNERLTEALSMADAASREEKLATWRSWPGTYDVHPKNQAEHFMPLLVCEGASGDEQTGSYGDQFGGMKSWTYYWNDSETRAGS